VQIYAEGKKIRVIVLLEESVPTTVNKNTIQDLINNPVTLEVARPYKRKDIYER
jgi:hypothetical protein